MKTCLACPSNVTQTSSIVTRLLLSAYMFLAFYMFTGDIGYGAIFTLIPLIIPYRYVCTNCKSQFLRLPKVNNINNYGMENNLDKFVIAMLPSMITITFLILKFPNTGLGRIVYLPSIFFVNSMIVFICLLKIRKLNKILSLSLWVTIIIITIILSILSYPQEYGKGIFELLWTARADSNVRSA